MLLAAGFLMGRLVSSGWQMLPAQRGGDRDTSAIGPETGIRGRSTNSPAGFPAAVWKDILLRVYGNIGQHRILALAAGITYYSILALFPAIAALVAIYGMFSNPASIATQLDGVVGLMPGGAIDVTREQLTRVASGEHHTLGLTFVVGLAVALWSANAATKALFDTLNVVYGEEEKRGFLRLNAVSLAFTVAAIGCGLLALGAVVVIPVALNYLPLSSSADLLIRLARWPALVAGLALALACVYRFGPSRKAPYWRWITWGSVAAGLLWLVASALFSWYAANFGTFNQTYGSLGAAIGFMTWLWISAIAILLGAELDAEIEHQTARGTGTGTANR
ncbi:YihY/virulence factor BrkB family protein [Bradyrhizobium sp. ORS 86]|uniref:YihY/virulence factor BrkB family protein n=1 Tax=Bradyrhizobium sp. ORS 86 TaxID=1685970 RepID=UPI00388D70FB